ncbi:MAG: NAD-dependent epimerase/dehydratase family protein [Planctomycetes bacterium]|nr:NAD-dependent epimerase/dehydratase family protein [Planctomycetota bacterium]
MARHLVTGACGLIGFALTRELAARGAHVVALDLGAKYGLGELDVLAREHAGRIEPLQADLADSSCLAHPSLRGPFDAVHHLAAVLGVAHVSAHPWECARVNMLSTVNATELALRARARVLVFASSSECYAAGVDAGRLPIPTPEDVELSISDIEAPRWSYAASKIAGEAAVFGAARENPSLRPVVVRFHNVYGPRMPRTHVVPELFARCAAKEDPFVVYGAEQTRSFLYVDDAARALALVGDPDAAHRGVFNVGSGTETSIEALLEACFETSGYRPRVIERRPAPPGSVARRVPDVTKLARLGFQARIELGDGLRRCWRERSGR